MHSFFLPAKCLHWKLKAECHYIQRVLLMHLEDSPVGDLPSALIAQYGASWIWLWRHADNTKVNELKMFNKVSLMKLNYERLFYKAAFSIGNNNYKVPSLPTSVWDLVEVHHVLEHRWFKKKQAFKRPAKHHQLNAVLFTVFKDSDRNVRRERRNNVMTSCLVNISIKRVSSFPQFSPVLNLSKPAPLPVQGFPCL